MISCSAGMSVNGQNVVGHVAAATKPVLFSAYDGSLSPRTRFLNTITVPQRNLRTVGDVVMRNARHTG